MIGLSEGVKNQKTVGLQLGNIKLRINNIDTVLLEVYTKL